MYLSADIGSGDSVVSGFGVGQRRSTRRTLPPTGRPVPVTVDDDDDGDLDWTAKANGVDGIVTSGSEADDNSSSVSSSVVDPTPE